MQEVTLLRTLRRAFPVPVLLITALVLVVQAVLLGSWFSQDSRLRELPLTISGPEVISSAITDQVNGLPEQPLAAGWQDDRAAARHQVETGASYGAVDLDLRGTRDTLVLHRAHDPRINDALVAQIRQVEASYGRTLTVTYVGPSDSSDHRERLQLLVLAAIVIGFLAVVVVSWRWGPVARDLRRGIRRIVLLALGTVVVGTLLSLLAPVGVGGDRRLVAVTLALASLTATTTTLAIEALLGWAGLGVAVTTFAVVGVPLVLGRDVHLLPAPWPQIYRFSSTGAADRGAQSAALFGADRLARPLWVMVAWFVVAAALIGVSRWVRSRHGVAAPSKEVRLHYREDGVVVGRSARRLVLWRVRTLALVLPIAVALVGGTLLVPTPAPRPPTTVVDRSFTTKCLATGTVRSVEDLNAITRLRGTSSFQGGDVGADTRLQDGRRLFFFGDTLRSGDVQPPMVRNSMLMVKQDCLASVLPKSQRAVIPDRDARAAGRGGPVGYWPMSVFSVSRPGYDLVYVFAQRVRTVSSDAFGFQTLGGSLAAFVVPVGGTPQLFSRVDLGPDDTRRSSPAWGAASWVVKHGGREWAYVYGTANPGDKRAFGYSLRAARVPVADLAHADKWQFWDGKRWQADRSRAVELIPAKDGVSQTLSVFPAQGRWYALSKRNDFLGEQLTVWTAPSPQGPFDGGRTVETIKTTGSTDLRYMPLAHPELLPQPGTVVVSYSRNSNDVGKVFENPLLYRPAFLRVELPK